MEKKINRKRVVKSLKEKGFYEARSGHHIYYYHKYLGKETGVFTYLSHSRKIKTISRDLLDAMKKQLRLDTQLEALQLMECPMSGEEYNEKLKEKGIIL